MLYTVGHSNYSLEDFLAILPPHARLADVRSHPTSRHPQFTGEALRAELGSRYQWWPGLGGWCERHAGYLGKFPGVDLEPYLEGHFPKQRIAAHRERDQGGPRWTSVGLYDYAWYQSTPEYLNAARELLRLSRSEDVAIMCCEALWYKCHRSMISDWFLYHGADSTHLAGRPTKTLGMRVSAKLHSAVAGNRLERYPEEVLRAWAG